MARKRPQGPSGRLVTVEYTSRVLADNPLGDPVTRSFPVWLPGQYDQQRGRNRGRRYPVLYDLVGYTGSGPSHTSWRSFSENVPERAARLVHARKMPPCIIVFPDCFTALGGNQYINSSAIGRYADYLTRELVPFVDREFRTLASRDHRGCFGKSSGGYGAIVHGMRYAKYWGAVGNHSGDAYFDFVYRSDWPGTLDTLAAHTKRKRSEGPVEIDKLAADTGEGIDDGRVRNFLEAIWQKDNPSHAEIHCLMNLCMAASYDPDPRVPNGFRLPFDLATGELLMPRWRRWLRHDPINMVTRYRDTLASLKGIYIDCGWRDQYFIHYGTRLLSRELGRAGIGHRYEEFDGTHSNIDFRMDRSLPFLARALS